MSSPTPQATPNSDATVAFITAAPERTYAPAVREAALMCLVDYMGVAIGAWHEPAADVMRRTVADWEARGRSRIWLGERTAPGLAALVNGTMGHCLDYDDTRAGAAAHLSSPTWSATLAVAEAGGHSEAEALGAFITGFEVATRLGGDVFENKLPFRGFHPTSVFGRFSAAAAAAVLMGLDAGQVAHALGVCGTTAAGLNASFGTMSKPFHPGKAAMDGILAAQMAARGFEAATHLLDAEAGLAGSRVQDGSAPISATGYTAGEALLHNSFKPYACGKLIHGHIDAARSLRERIDDRPIAQVRVAVSPIGRKLVGRATAETHLEAKFSVAFCVAMGLLGYPLVASDFSEERVRDPAVRALMAKVETHVDKAVGDFGSVMDVVLEGGETLHAEVAESRGNPSNPLSWDDLHTKFSALVAPVIGDRAEPLYEALRSFEQPGRLAEVLALVAEPPA